MKELINNLKGDKVIWSFVVLLALISFMPVFSASTNLVYVIGKGSTIGYLIKHFAHICIGFGLIYLVHKVPYHYYRGLSQIALPIVALLLVYTFFQGTVIDGANASRWIQVPFIGVTFQTSALASIVLMVYVARYLAKMDGKEITFKQSFFELWVPVFIILALILPANFSTAALIFSMVCMLVFIGKYPMRYLGTIIGMGVAMLALFVLFAKAFPDVIPNRVDTWISRVERFWTDAPDEDDYQIEKAKIAIATGGVYGLGPGKSVQKNFLPQSSSDFIFAIICEELGFFGAALLIFVFVGILLAGVSIIGGRSSPAGSDPETARKAVPDFSRLFGFGILLTFGLQSVINIAVVTGLAPTKGIALPLVSQGGTGWVLTAFSLGLLIAMDRRAWAVSARAGRIDSSDETQLPSGLKFGDA